MKNPKAIAVCTSNGDLVFQYRVFQYESGAVPLVGARIDFCGASYVVVSHDHQIEKVIVTVEVLP